MRLTCALAGLLLATTAHADAREFRVFSLAHFHELEQVESYASYRAAIRSQFDALVAPHLRADVPNLVTYPENQTLMAFMLGTRGAAARAVLDDAGAVPALAGMAAPYAPQIAYYEARFPGVDSPGQLLQLALTDTLGRVLEIFTELAAEHGVYLAVSSNLAPFERITGADALLLADPEAGTDYAYRAVESDVRNRNFIFGPDGDLLTAQDKAYLVPIERERALGLGLRGIEVAELPVFDLPFARVATVISKDAWMPDVNDRLDQLGAELLIQSEAFSTWGLPDGPFWAPDKFQRGGWWMVQKHPSFAVNATPMLIGNFGDLTFDGQPLVAVEGFAGVAGLCLMGQQPEYGWAAVGAWSTLPQSAVELCGEALRPALMEYGQRLLPASGDVLENAYVSNAVFADIRLPPQPAAAHALPPAARASRALDLPGQQLQPQLATDGNDAWLTFVDTQGLPRQTAALAYFDGDGFAAPVYPDPQSVSKYDHFDNQWSPTAAVIDGGVTLAFLGFPTENWDLFSLRMNAGGDISPPARLDDAHTSEGVDFERGHSSPRLIAAGEHLLAVWSDLRWPFIKPQVRVAHSTDAGAAWSASSRADGADAGVKEHDQVLGRAPGETRGQAYPDVAALEDGALLVVWQEQDADGVAAIWLGQGRLPGLDFGVPQRVSGPVSAYRPRLAQGHGRVLLTYEERDPRGGTRIMLRERSGAGWHPPRALDPTAVPGSVQRHARPLLLPGGWAVVYEDRRGADAHVLLMTEGGESPRRLDDSAPGTSSLAPDAAVLHASELLVVWQHENAGGAQLRWTRWQASPARRGGGASGLLWLALLPFAALAAQRKRRAVAARRQ